jgi:hypothetical protein
MGQLTGRAHETCILTTVFTFATRRTRVLPKKTWYKNVFKILLLALKLQSHWQNVYNAIANKALPKLSSGLK